MKPVYKSLLLLLISLFFTFSAAFLAESEEVTAADSIEMLDDSTWGKRILLVEPYLNRALIGRQDGTYLGAGIDLWYMLSSDWALGIGSGVMNIGSPGNYLYLSGQGRYYLPLALTREIGLPFSRLYVEGKAMGFLGGGPGLDPQLYTNAHFSLLPQMGLEILAGTMQTRFYTGLQLTPTDQGLHIQSIVGFGLLNFTETFDTQKTEAYLQAYEQTLKNLNETPPPFTVRLRYGSGLPEGPGLTIWLRKSSWSIGFFNGDSSPREQLGLLLRHTWEPQRFGGTGYLETVFSTGTKPSLGVRGGYEFQPAEWLSLECSLGVGYGVSNTTNPPNLGGQTGAHQVIPMGYLGITLIQPLPISSPTDGH